MTMLYYATAFFIVGYIFPFFGSFKFATTLALITASAYYIAARHYSQRRTKILGELMPHNLPERPGSSKSQPAASVDMTDHYDVVIMGGGVVGLIQALVLVRKLPSWATVAVVEPKDSFEDHKWGESMVEVSTTLLTKDLGLQDYLMQNHSPKHGLFYHWPRDVRLFWS